MSKAIKRAAARRKAAKKRVAQEPAGEPESSNSLARMLGLLDLFTSAAPIWSTDDLIRYIGVSRSTGYRYIRALHGAGLLAAVANGSYILGRRIMEFDRQIRQCDPMYGASGPIMKALVADTGHSALLCALFSDSVMCVREELSENSPPNIFTRGQRRPLFAGAASKVILPYLSPHQLRNLYARHKKTIASAGLGSDWTTFRRALAKVRADGYVMTLGEFNSEVVGLSAPIFNSSNRILGSLGIAAQSSYFDRAKLVAMAERVMAAAKELTERIGSPGSVLDRPPRAVG